MASKVEHVLKEAPYLLADTNRRGWGIRCDCGWRSPLVESSEEALALGQAHLEDTDVAAPAPAKGWLARRRARRQQRPDWMERRRD